MPRPFHNRKRRGGAGLRPAAAPGKFEGETIVSQWLYEESLIDANAVYSDGAGNSVSLIEGPFPSAELRPTDLNRDERRFIARQAGAIVYESDEGFVWVAWYDNDDELTEAWDAEQDNIERHADVEA
jgi:hypothetical protein